MMADTIQPWKLVSAGCGSCSPVESLMRRGVPLREIEDWLDFNENRSLTVAGRKPAPAPGSECKGLTLRPTT